jgi:spore coat protein A
VLPTGPKTLMWTYGGSYPGPTIRRPAGHDTKVTFTNDLPAAAGAITVHLHGDHHSAASNGQPDTDLIGRGAQRTYDYPLTDAGQPGPEAFDFYHDHRMNETSRNNWYGLQGMFIVDSKEKPSVGLPSGRYDVPLLVSDRSFTANNQLTDPFADAIPMSSMSTGKKGPGAPPDDATIGNRILVDGRVTPYMNVATHRYRLRLLNASNFESYNFVLSDGRSFVQIGTGDDLLPSPVVRRSILLGPSQRADVIVDFRGQLHQRVVLESVPSAHSPLGIGTPAATIMQFRVTRTAADHTRIPATLARPPAIKAPKTPSMTWTFGLGGNTRTGTYWTGRNHRRGSVASRTPGDWTRVRRWSWPPGSPTTPASSWSTATCSTTRTTALWPSLPSSARTPSSPRAIT